MATVIDELVVKLGMDNTGFKQGERQVSEGLDSTRKQSERTGKQVEASGKQAAEFFNQMRGAAIRFFAVLTVGGGMANFTRTVIQTGANLDRMSRNLGVSADTLSRWGAAAKISGGSAEGFLGTMQGLSSALTELKLTGTTGILPYLQALGVSVADTEGKARPLEEILADIGDKLNAMPNREDAFNIGRNLGIDDGTINLLLKGRTEVERLLAAQKAYSDADAKSAREASEHWEQVKLNIERTSQELVIKLLPSLEKIANAMARFAEAAVPVLAKAIDMFTDLDEATNGWASTLAICLATLRLITGPAMIGGLGKMLAGTARLGALGAAGYVGYKAGEQISDKLPDSVKDSIGRNIARVLAFMGNDEAQAALDAEGGVVSQPAPSSGGRSRAERNFNPGNLEFRGQAGAVREDGSGRFAKFGSMSEGVSALVKQLQRYGARGLDTLSKIINTYAPSGENNTQAYIQALASRLGVGANDTLNLGDSNVMAQLVRGISTHEAGNNFLTDADLMSGLSMAGLGRGSASGGGGSVSIGEIKVYTQATDARGIVRDMNQEIVRQADTGMQ